MRGKVCPGSLKTSVPTVRPLTSRHPWGSTRLGSVTVPLSVLRMSVCVSLLSPAWLPSSAFTAPDRRSYSATGTTPMAPNFCAGAYPLGEQQTSYLLERDAMATCAKGIQNAHFSKGQKVQNSSARKERHVEQGTPLHCSH